MFGSNRAWGSRGTGGCDRRRPSGAMKILSWNCRGLGQPRTVQELVCLVSTHRPSIIFLSETRQNKERASNLRWRLGLKNCMLHDGCGKGAGIALYWDESFEIKKLSVGPRYIDVLIRNNPNEQWWRGTFVYGEPRAHERIHMWNLLRRFKHNSNAPWLAIGDFNETQCQSEHFSASRRSEKQMADFREVLEWCDLYDLGYRGPAWTYNNKQEGRKNVKARLDRGVASPDWSNRFQNARVEHICSARSDHLPLLLQFSTRTEYRRKKEFRYEALWEREGSLQEVIEDSWKSSGPASSLKEIKEKLNVMQQNLSKWSSVKIGSVTRKVSKLRKRMHDLMNKTTSLANDREIKKVGDELDELLLREEILWRQRPRATYLREGERNAEWFHRQATWRKKHNTITRLMNENGQWVEQKEILHNMSTNFFKGLYTEDKNINPQGLLGLFNEMVSQGMNEALEKDFTEKEISDALFQIGPLKAPGPDGFHARFYQRNWGIIKGEVVDAVKQFFADGIMPEGLNDTVIVLIPKGSDPKSLRDFRPISLCNVIYKVISKCLVNRLRPLLDELISETQKCIHPRAYDHKQCLNCL